MFGGRSLPMPRIVMVPAGLGSLDKSFQATDIDMSKASEGYIKARANGKELILPLSSILYIESD
jgi:hypothetical protein